MSDELQKCTQCNQPTPSADLQRWAEKCLCPKCWEEWGDFLSSRDE